MVAGCAVRAVGVRPIKGMRMSQMPGTARSARVVLFAVGALSVVAVVWLGVVAAMFETGALGGLILGMLLLAATLFALLAVASFVLATKFTGGGRKVRFGAVVVGWVTFVGSTIAALASHAAWGAATMAGALLLVLSVASATKDWFDVPHHVRMPARWPE